MSRLRPRRGDDTGASLILALAFMIGIGLVSGGLLTYASTSFRAALAVQSRAKLSYDAEGALQAAIAQTTASSYDNAPGENCLSNGFMTFTGPNGNTMAVSCAPGVDTGAASGRVPINDHNRPDAALLTLGTSGSEPGLDLGSNNILFVHGGVAVNSGITAGGHPCAGSPQPPTGNCSELYDDSAQVLARGSCPGVSIFSTPAAVCNTHTAYADPDYAAPATGTSALVYRSVPPSCPAGAVVTFEPGYYDDGAALNQLFDSCGARTFWFKPGTYFFDFHNDGSGLWSGSSHDWAISNPGARVVGGTPSGWNPAGGGAPSIPGACLSPLDSTANGGVEFVFGGDSRLSITNAKVELCGRYSSDAPPIAVYGAKSGSDPAPSSATLVTDGSGTGYGHNITFAHPEYITDTGQTPVRAATAVITAPGGGRGGRPAATASVVVTGFGPPAQIPAGSVLTSATLLVSHRDENLSTGDSLNSLRVTETPDRSGASAHTVAVPTYQDRNHSGYHADTIDLTSQLQDEVHSYGFTGMSLRYDASVAAGNSVTEYLDTLQLQLTYVLPAVRAEGGCVGAAPYPSGGSCALVTTRGAQTAFYVAGTTYVPRAALDIQLTNASGQVFRAGLIARTLRIQVTASSSYPGPVLDVPSNSSGPTPLQVFFTAYTCPQGSSCNPADLPNAPWQKVALAQAAFTDPSGSPVPGSRTVHVGSWQLLR